MHERKFLGAKGGESKVKKTVEDSGKYIWEHGHSLCAPW